MAQVFTGSCATLLPHPSLTQFDEDTLLSTFFDRSGSERGGALDKWFYFYCNPVLDPVVIEIDEHGPHLHPGLKRFIGTALRGQQQLPAWIVSTQQRTAAGITVGELAYSGPDWMKWIVAQKSCEFTNDQIRTWMQQHVRFRWELELPNGDVFVLNPYAQQVEQRYRVNELGLVGALKQMYEDCCEKTTPPALLQKGLTQT